MATSDPAQSRPRGARRRGLRQAIKRNAANAATTLTIASKNFTEEFILGEIYAQALAAGGYKVRKRLNFGSELVAFARSSPARSTPIRSTPARR